MQAADVAAMAPAARKVNDGEAYRMLRETMLKGPVETGRLLPELLLSDPDKGLEGKIQPYYYQSPTVGHMLFQTWDIQDYLFPTGMGKTFGVSMGEALRMFFQTEKAAIIGNTDKITRYIRDTVHGFYETGHPMLRNALMDSAQDRVEIKRPNGDISVLECHTANLNNMGDSLLGMQGYTTIIIDERSILPDAIFTEKIDRITPPKGQRRLLVGITTTQEANHTYEWTEAWLLPKRADCDPTKFHLTDIGGAVSKCTWRDGQKVGREGFDEATIRRRHKQMGEETFANWYECEFPTAGGEKLVPGDLWRIMTNGGSLR